LIQNSVDATEDIARSYGAQVAEHPFENHPKQWDFALRNAPICTPWVVCLDADQVVSPELFRMLQNFRDADFSGIDGIYFNRKNLFKGRWIRYGGYFPKYMLKMFRYDKGVSDLNENMDHRFIVEGPVRIWKTGYLVEENLKENDIGFWIDKHNRYANLVAQEEVERRLKLKQETRQGRLSGTPDERIALFKRWWRCMPLYIRPFLYFFYRYFLRLGFLDGKQGFVFHYLQAFWFRLVVDIKMEELLEKKD